MLEDRKLYVLYGSQTGTALEVAETITRQAVRLHFDVDLSSLDSFDMVSLSLTECYLLFKIFPIKSV